MSQRADEAVAALRAELEALELLTNAVSEADWSKPCPGEDWPMSLVAFHIARGFQRQAEFVEEAHAGHGPHRFADSDLDRIAFVYEGRERSTLWVVSSLAVRHARGHRESIAAAIS